MRPKSFIVYYARTTATTPPKVYIGITSRSLKERRAEHEKDAANDMAGPFLEAIREVGIDRFEWGELLRNLPEDVARQREGALAESYKNIGDEVLTRSYSSKRDLLSSPKSFTTRSPEKRPPFTDQQRQLRSLYGKRGNDNPDSQRRQQIAGKRYPVIEIETNIKYDSVSAAANKTRDSKSSVKRSATFGTPTSSGRIYAFLDLNGNSKPHQTQITQRVKCRNFNKIFEDEKRAASTYGLTVDKIRRICKGKQQYARKREDQLTFCYLDDQGNEKLTNIHIKYTKELQTKEKIHIAAFRSDDIDYTKPIATACDAKTLCAKLKDFCGKSPNHSHVTQVCQGKRQHNHGFRFTYWNPNTQEAIDLTKRHGEKKLRKQFRAVHQLDHENRSIGFWRSLGEAEKSLKISAGLIQRCCEGNLYATRSYNKTERLRFAFDKMGGPDLRDKHTQERGWPGNPIIGIPSGKRYASRAKWMRDMDLRPKFAKTYAKNRDPNKLQIKGNRWYHLDSLPTGDQV